MEPTNYIYLVKEREFIKTNENIYKIGRSKQENTKRFLQYPKGSELIIQSRCIDCIKTEKILIDLFKKNFIHRRDIGNEYFEGNDIIMQSIIHNLLYDDLKHVNKVSTIEKIIEITPTINPIIINKYEEFIKYNNIHKIIIKNNKGDGYIKFNNELWENITHNLCDKNLFYYIKHNQNKNYTDSHGNIIDIEYENDNILIDITQKCVNKIIHYYFMEHSEFLIEDLPTKKRYMFNLSNYTFIPIDKLLNEQILLSTLKDICPFIIKNYQNTTIVDELLNSLVNTDILINYKNIIFSTLFNNNPVFFYDYNEKLLSYWLFRIINNIDSNYSNNSFIENHAFKRFRDLPFHFQINKPKYIVIEKIKEFTIPYQIKEVKNCLIKSIFVHQNDDNNQMYSMNSYNNFLKNNKERIIKIIKEETNYEIKNWEKESQELFTNPYLLQTNFLKWCSDNYKTKS